jgi:hypothetical protein
MRKPRSAHATAPPPSLAPAEFDGLLQRIDDDASRIT